MAGRIEQKHKEHAYKKFGEDLKNNDFRLSSSYMALSSI